MGIFCSWTFYLGVERDRKLFLRGSFWKGVIGFTLPWLNHLRDVSLSVNLSCGRWTRHLWDRIGLSGPVWLSWPPGCSPTCGRRSGRSRWMLRLCGNRGGWNRPSSSCTETPLTCCLWMAWRSWGRQSRGWAARPGPQRAIFTRFIAIHHRNLTQFIILSCLDRADNSLNCLFSFPGQCARVYRIFGLAEAYKMKLCCKIEKRTTEPLICIYLSGCKAKHAFK